MRTLTALLVCGLAAIIADAQNTPSPILFIYDASGSMWGQMDESTKKEIASDVLTKTIEGLAEGQALGLIAYGHRKKGDCDDIEYLVDLQNTDKKAVTDALRSIQPLGKTPLARSATMAIESLKTADIKATVILITDGIESCDGDLCRVVADARAEGIPFKMHIVGFGLTEGNTEALKCAARAGGGHYYDAADAEGLGDVLGEVTVQTVDEGEANFSLYAVKNSEAVDAWVRPTDLSTGKELRGSRTYRDTARLHLPAGLYQIDVRPLEGSDIPSTFIQVRMTEGETTHRDVSFDGGILSVTTTNNGEPWDAMVKMFDASGKVAASTRMYGKTKEMEVPAGAYRVTYTALGMEGLDIHYEASDVMIQGGETTSVSHDFKSGTAWIGVQSSGGELIDATVNFRETSEGKNVAAARTYTSPSSNPKKFILSPGTYEVKVVTLGKHKGHSDTFTITVAAGGTTEKTIRF